MPRISLRSSQPENEDGETTECVSDKDQRKKMMAAERSQKYRQRNNPEYREKERNRKKEQRRKNQNQPKSKEQLEHQREQGRARMAQFRQRQRDKPTEMEENEQEVTPKKPLTRAEHEKKKDYNRIKKREERTRHSAQKKRRIREKDRVRKRLSRATNVQVSIIRQNNRRNMCNAPSPSTTGTAIQ